MYVLVESIIESLIQIILPLVGFRLLMDYTREFLFRKVD